MEQFLCFGESLRIFQNKSSETVFTEASAYPPFFEKHLLHPARKIKVLSHDPNALIRAFYFQYLVLCFEIDNPKFEAHIGRLKEYLLEKQFKFIFQEEDDPRIFNDYQFKRFLIEFLQILDSGEYSCVEEALNKYPIADLVFVYFFRALAILHGIAEDLDSYLDRNKLLNFLLQAFGVEAAIYEEKCLKFTEAQMFVYEDTPTKVYLVYKQIEEESESGQSSQKNDPSEDEKQSQKDLEPQQNQQIMQNQEREKVQSQFSRSYQKVEERADSEKNFKSDKFENGILGLVSIHDAPERHVKDSPELPITNNYQTPFRKKVNNDPKLTEGFSSQSTNQKSTFQSKLFFASSQKKAKFTKLNITKEFTDSMILEKMGQPFCSRIRGMKKRSREYRSSISRYLL